MSVIEKAAQWMERCAANPNCGYDQEKRWGPDYDCSSAVISAWEFAGVPVRSRGASYTGDMYSVFLASGFEDVTDRVDMAIGSGLKRGDVLLNHVHHTAMYMGEGMEAEASINELGLTTGGETGDQTGTEFYTRPYRNYPWDCVLRYVGTEAGREKPWYFYKVSLPLLKPGMESFYIRALQLMLRELGLLSSQHDGIYGQETKSAVLELQKAAGIETDGECGGQTWAALFKAFER